MPRNIELKARIRLAEATPIAAAIATAGPEVQRQRDVYFRVPTGRLKLRFIQKLPDGPSEAQLIAYQRSDAAEARGSDYFLSPVADPVQEEFVLALALGVEAVVEKVRTIYWQDNVRIHLDAVAGLGEFLEFEAVLAPPYDDARGHAQLAELSAKFNLRPDDVLSASYRELLMQASRDGNGA